jgi:DNA-binding phage protein
MIDAIIKLAESQGISAYRLAKDSGGRISHTTAYRLLSGDADIRLSTLIVACEVLGVNLTVQESTKARN